MHLFAASLFLTVFLAVKGQDPTTVCYPQIFTMSYFSMFTEDKGTIYVDFTKERYAEVSSLTGNRFLHDFTNLRSYAIRDQGNDTTCQSFKLLQSQIMYRCLPPYAKTVADATGFFGHVTAARTNVQTWEVETEYDTVYRIVFSVVASQPYEPVISQQFGYHGTTEVFLYTNHSITIPNVNVLTIPDSCDTRGPATIVG